MTPEEAWKFIEAEANFQDCGPEGEGWRSEEMKEAVAALEAHFKPAASKCCARIADDDRRGQLRVAAGHLSYAAHLTELLLEGKEASREEAEYDAREGLVHLRKGLGDAK